MMKHKSKRSSAIEGFSVLKMKQEIQSQIYRETEGMTSEEFLEYIRRGSEHFKNEMKHWRKKKPYNTDMS